MCQDAGCAYRVALEKIVSKAEADTRQVIRLTDVREILEDTCGTEGIIEDLPDYLKDDET